MSDEPEKELYSYNTGKKRGLLKGVKYFYITNIVETKLKIGIFA